MEKLQDLKDFPRGVWDSTDRSLGFVAYRLYIVYRLVLERCVFPGGAECKKVGHAHIEKSDAERRCSILGPTQIRISPSTPQYTKIQVDDSGKNNVKFRPFVLTAAANFAAHRSMAGSRRNISGGGRTLARLVSIRIERSA